MNPKRILVFAYSDVGHACLSYLLQKKEDVVAVYTHEDKPGESLWFPSVATLATRHKIPVFTQENLAEPNEMSILRRWAPDLIFSFYYRNMIPSCVLALPVLGAYNMHGSHLPKYRGRAPVNWAVLNGETTTGATLHVMVEKPDAGDIVDQEVVPIGPDETAIEVQKKVTEAAVRVLARQIENLKINAAPHSPQDPQKATYFGRRRPDDGRIDWNWPAAKIHNLIRGVTHPYPGAFGDLDGEKVWIWKSRLCSGASNTEGLFVRCGDGNTLEILSMQKENGPEIAGRDYMKQRHVSGRER